MAITLEEQAESLTREQRAICNEITVVRQQRDHFDDNYGRLIVRARKTGMSYGLIGHVLGVPKETVWRSEQRYLARREHG